MSGEVPLPEKAVRRSAAEIREAREQRKRERQANRIFDSQGHIINQAAYREAEAATAVNGPKLGESVASNRKDKKAGLQETIERHSYHRELSPLDRILNGSADEECDIKKITSWQTEAMNLRRRRT